MSNYENIQHPDTHQFDHRPLDRLRMQAELDFYRARYERACDDLRSIYDRAEAGEPVYFVTKAGGHMRIIAIQDDPELGAELGANTRKSTPGKPHN